MIRSRESAEAKITAEKYKPRDQKIPGLKENMEKKIDRLTKSIRNCQIIIHRLKREKK